MAVFAGPEIPNSGLVLHLDAANLKSKSYNLITNPENLGSLLSLRAGASITTDATTAPDGTQTADLITGTGSGFGYYFPNWPTGNATHSFFVKPNGATTTFTFDHVGTAQGGTFTFSTGAFSSVSGYTPNYTALSNGWYLITFSTTTETANYYVELSFNNNNGGYIWGVQLTPFAFYKSYIPLSTGLTATTNTNSFIDMARGLSSTLTNGPSFSSLNNGNIAFDGVDDHITIPTAITSSFTEATIEIVFRVNDAGNSGNAYLLWDHSAGSPMWLGKSQGNEWYWFWNFNGGRGKSARLSSTSYVANSWIHIAVRFYLSNTVTISETNNFAELIVNGSSYSTAHRNDSDLALNFPTTSMYLARKGTASGNGELGATVANYSNVNIALFKIYNRVLSRAEVRQNYEAYRDRYGI